MTSLLSCDVVLIVMSEAWLTLPWYRTVKASETLGMTSGGWRRCLKVILQTCTPKNSEIGLTTMDHLSPLGSFKNPLLHFPNQHACLSHYMVLQEPPKKNQASRVSIQGASLLSLKQKGFSKYIKGIFSLTLFNFNILRLFFSQNRINGIKF